MAVQTAAAAYLAAEPPAQADIARPGWWVIGCCGSVFTARALSRTPA